MTDQERNSICLDPRFNKITEREEVLTSVDGEVYEVHKVQYVQESKVHGTQYLTNTCKWFKANELLHNKNNLIKGDYIIIKETTGVAEGIKEAQFNVEFYGLVQGE